MQYSWNAGDPLRYPSNLPCSVVKFKEKNYSSPIHAGLSMDGLVRNKGVGHPIRKGNTTH